MLTTALWTLRQRRYAALAALMVVVAAICVVAGTWQISRFNQSVRDNNALDANASAPTVPLTAALVPLVGRGPRPHADDIKFRTVTATGTYTSGRDEFVGNQTLDGTDGYYVLAPLRTDAGVLLVVRGFVAGTSTGAPPSSIAAPPAGTVQLTGRLQTASTQNDAADELSNGELESINPAQQATRLGTGVYDAYVTLDSGQPGSAGVTVLPDPDLSNPAGGAYEWQHFAYIIQWYLFALLALAAPFLIARHEIHEARQLYLGIDPARERFAIEDDDEATDGPARLGAGTGSGPGDALAVRTPGTIARRGQPTAEQWRRAAKLADRYGRSLGVTDVGPVEEELPAGPRAARAARADRADRAERADFGIESSYRRPVPNISAEPARSIDDYHGAYNDYLWELSLADGNVPDVVPPIRDVDDSDDRRAE